MDYDDNDFQTQGFHLGGDDNTKFPPLRSCAPPKFDFDEHLQVHLQFDNLVDTEVFLGIQNQETSWIEDFSGGSRHNNVWSEAASSESVEMLLKSVGQDVSIAKQNTIQESNVCDGLVSLKTQMDPNLNQDGPAPSKMEGTVDTIPTQPPDKCPQSSLTLSKYCAEDHHYIEGMPLTQKDDKSRYENFKDSDRSSVDSKSDSFANVASKQCSLVPKATPSYIENLSQDDHSSVTGEVAGENLDSVAFESMEIGPSSVTHGAVFSKKLGDRMRTGIHQTGCSLLSNDSVMGDQIAGSMPQQASSVATEGDRSGGTLVSVTFKSSMHVGSSATSVQNLLVGATEGCSEVVSCEKPEGLLEDIGKNEILEQNVQNDGIHCIERAVKGVTDDLENFSSSAAKLVSLVQIAVSHDDVSSEMPDKLLKTGTHQIDCRVLSKDNEMGDQAAGSMLQEPFSVATEGDGDRGDLGRAACRSVQAGLSATSIQELVMGSIDRCNEVVSCDNLKGLTEGVSASGHSLISRHEAHTDDIHFVGPAAESFSDSIDNFRSSMLKRGSYVQVAASHEAVVSEKIGELLNTDNDHLGHRVLNKDGPASDQVAGIMLQEASIVATEGERESEGNFIKKGNVLMENPWTTPMVKMDYPVQPKGPSDLACHQKPQDLLNDDGRVESGFPDKCTESDVQIRGRKLDSSSSVIEENVDGESVDNSNSNVGELSSSGAMVCSSTGNIHEKQEMAEIKPGLDSSVVEGANVISFDLKSAIMEKKMTDKLVQNDGNNQDVTSNISGVHNSVVGINDILSPKDASLSQTCADRSVDIASGDDHMVHSDGPVIAQENINLSTYLDNRGVEIGGCLVIETSHGQSTSSVNAAMLESKSQHGDALKSDEVIEQKDGKPPFSVSNFMHLDKEESVNAISTHSYSVLKSNCDSHAVSASLPGPDFGQRSLCNTAEKMLAVPITNSTAAEKSTDLSRASIGITSTQESVPSEVISEEVTMLESLKTLDRSSLVADKVVRHKDEEPSLPLSNHIILDEESFKAISRHLCSSVQEENSVSHASSCSIPVSDSAKHAVCNAAAEMEAERTSQPAAAGKSVDIPAPIFIESAWESGRGLKPRPGVHTSNMNQSRPDESRVSSDKRAALLDVTGKTDGEILIENMPSSLDGSSDDNVQNNKQLNEANSVSGDGNSEHQRGDLITHCKASSLPPVTLSVNVAQLHTLEDGSGNIKFSEPSCGSPTVISCIEPSQIEKEYHGCTDEGSSDQNIPISDDAHKIDGMVDTVKFTAHNPKEKAASEEDASFTFLVGPEKESGKGWEKFSYTQGFESSQIAKESRTAPGLCQINPEILQETPHGKHQVSVGQKLYGTAKAIGEDKARLVSVSAAKRTVAAGRKRAKETSRSKQTVEKNSNPCNALVKSDGTTSRLKQAEEITQYALIKGNHTKAACVPTVQSSSLPDLNTSASPMTMLHQPFTILQQVQLRAQIFVYGSLIQGTAPDEACMISAFGDTSRDGGRNVWESVWRAAVEIFNNQKLILNNLETPLHSQSGARVSKSTSLPSVALSSPASRSASKGVASAIVNPSLSLSSPVRNYSIAHDGFPSSSTSRISPFHSHQLPSPLHPCPTLQMRPCVGNTSPWQSQASGPGLWVVSPQTSALDISTRDSALPIVEAVKVSSVRDSSTPSTSSAQLVSPSPSVPTGGPADVLTSANLLIEEKSKKHASADQKPKRRKKIVVAEHGQISSFAKRQNEPASSIGATKHSVTSECILSPSPPNSAGPSAGLVTSSPVPLSMHYNIVTGGNTDQRVIFSEETCSRIEQAKLHAEDAAALADSAVRQSQGIWNQLAINKDSGLLAEVKAELASAAVAAAVAASVAKAAAAAAKVASDAALQAKLMADEALVMPKLGNCAQDSGIGLLDGRKNLESFSPAPIMKGKDKTESSRSMIVAARESARKRVEVTSAAEKRAKNLDAVVKAAELAAAAVSQAGVVITMGDPIPLTLSELVEAGPEGYWKAQQNLAEHPVKANGLHTSGQLSTVATGECLDNTVEHLKEQPPSKSKTQGTAGEGKMSTTKDLVKESVENQLELVSSSQERFGGQEGQKMSDVSKTVEVISEIGVGSKALSLTAQNDEDERHQLSRTSKDIHIKEGSLVEVVSDEDGLRGVWFSANVQSLKDGKAYVCYTDLLQDEGRGRLKEWISLETEGDKPPRIRIAHPMTAMRFEGARKRRRAAMESYVWSVGDRVDAWMRDGWWEGIIIEKSDSDEAKLTVHFPADGDSSIIRSWNLRPSLIWKDGQWIEWSRDKNCFPHEVDFPEEKRQKLGRHEIEIDTQLVLGGNKQSKIPGIEDLRESEESRLLLNKGNVMDSISDGLKMKRTGLQKEGQRVVFGIPKPGKKRKFMEVSKHYIADGVAKTNERTESVKFAKYLVPQGSLGWKNPTKVDVKGKRPTVSKPKVLYSGKYRTVPSRSISEQNGGGSIPVVSASSSSTSQDILLNVRTSVGHKEYHVDKSSHLEGDSFSKTLKAAEGELESGVQSFNDASSSDRAEGATKGKLSVPGRKLAREEEKASSIPGKPIQEAVEPRRSNRRIQPTSRLLEGLQSSFIISKIPSLSNSRGAKTQHRSASSSRGNNRA